MLRFPEQTAFEAWLQSCPLDRESLEYSVARRGNGSLHVALRWELQGLVHGPDASVPDDEGHVSSAAAATEVGSSAVTTEVGSSNIAASQPASGDVRPSEKEEEEDADLRGEIAKKREDIARMSAMIAAAGTSAVDGPGAALAAMFATRGRGMGEDITSAEAVRAQLAQMGMALPHPPGPTLRSTRPGLD